MNKTNKINKEKSMKLKSILMLSMVAIMAMAGSAFATTSTSATSTTDSATFTFDPLVDTSGTNPFVFSEADTLAAGSGTGLVGGMPTQVAFDDVNPFVGYLTAASGPDSGYNLDTLLFGYCGGIAGVNCPKFLDVVILSGDGTTSQEPAGTGAFNQANFLTGLVTSASDTGFENGLSQKTIHFSVPNGDGDYIDQRLSQVIGSTDQQLRQVAIIGAGSAVSSITDGGAVDPLWLTLNDGMIWQAIADASAGQNASNDNGSYGQLFHNTTVVTDAGLVPDPVDGIAGGYNAGSAVFGFGSSAQIP
jgi:hypothetical protein